MRKGRVFVDTNVLIYMFDPADEKKRATAIRTVRDLGSQLVVSTQILTEFFWVVTRKLGVDQVRARSIVGEMCEGEVVATTSTLVSEAIDLSIVSGYALWDALVVQSAIASRCQTILTEDLSHGQTVKGVRIENPFIA